MGTSTITTLSTATTTTLPTATNDKGDNEAAIIVGSVVGSVGVVIIICIVIVAVTLKRWQRRRNEEKKREFQKRLKDYNEISVISDSAETDSSYNNKSYAEDGFENSSENPDPRKSDSTNVEKDANDNTGDFVGSQVRAVKLSNKTTVLNNANAYAIVSIYTSSDKNQEITEMDKGNKESNHYSEQSSTGDSENLESLNQSNVFNGCGSEMLDNKQVPIYYELEKVVDDDD